MLIKSCLQAQSVWKKYIIKFPTEILENNLYPITFCCRFSLLSMYFIKMITSFDEIHIGNILWLTIMVYT